MTADEVFTGDFQIQMESNDSMRLHSDVVRKIKIELKSGTVITILQIPGAVIEIEPKGGDIEGLHILPDDTPAPDGTTLN